MERVFVVNEQGQREEVDAVRYFEYNGFNYFIYDKNEKDENGYVKLYVNKNQNGNILPIDDNEWTSLKTMFQNILKANRDSASLPVKDLNLNTGEIKVAYNQDKAFKLADKIVELLGKNKPVFNDSTTEINDDHSLNTNNPFTNPAISNNFDINNTAPINPSFNSNFGMNDFNTGGINTPVSDINPFNSNSNFVGNDINNQSSSASYNHVQEDVQPTSNVFNPMFGNVNNNPFNSNFGQVQNNVSDMNGSMNNQNPFGQNNFNNTNSSFNNNVETVDYKALYEEEKTKNENLSNELASVKDELNMFTAKFEQLKQIIG